jgi:hypothetical protein
MDIKRIFTEHPSTVGESYGEHLVTAAGFGARMLVAGSACMIHALLPFLFQKNGSRTIAELNIRMVTGRRDSPASIMGEQGPSE